jgi:outer membrane protein assembly factor BamB
VVTDEYVFEVSSTLLYAIERSTGSVAWRFGREPIHGRPLVNGELVIVSGSESVFGLNVTDGMLEWTATETPQSTPAETALRARSRSLTTALHRDSVITLHDADPSTMVAYDSDDGETAWTRSFDSSVRGIATTDEHVITVSKNETQHRCTVTCVSANDGDQRWVEEIEIDVSDGPTEHSSVGRPLVADDTVFVDTGWSPPVLMTDGGRSFSTFAGDGTLTALDVETGARRWRCPLGEEAFFKAVTGDRLYICGAGGTVHAFEDTGTEVYAETALNFCANCGTDLRPYDGPRYCPTCGDSLEERG